MAAAASGSFFDDAETFLRDLNPGEVCNLAKDVKATWHPTGFGVYHLPIAFEGRSVRLHIWPSTIRLSPPHHPAHHNHNWDLLGLVLAGQYVEETLTVSPTSYDTGLALYDVSYRSLNNAAVIQLNRRIRVDSRTTRSFLPGEVHALEATTFHRAQPPERELTATIVVTAAQTNACQLLGQVGYQQDKTTREPFPGAPLDQLTNALEGNATGLQGESS